MIGSEKKEMEFEALTKLMIENQKVLYRLANYGDEYYTAERFAIDNNMEGWLKEHESR